MYGVPDDIDVYIDVNGVDELHGYKVESQSLTVGANTPLTELIRILKKVADDNPGGFSYLHRLVSHILLIANVPVRNVSFDFL